MKARSSIVQTIQLHALSVEAQQLIHNVLSAYFRTKPLEELVNTKDRSQRPVQLKYIALAGAECSSCISENQDFKQPRLRISPLDLREEAVQQLLSDLKNSLLELCSPTHSVEGDATILRSECIELLCQVMCRHDSEQLILLMLEFTEER